MYKVTLKACGNIDHDENPYLPIVNKAYIESKVELCKSIEECQKKVREYIEKYNLGAGNWIGGEVYEKTKNYVGRISYNGKFWDKKTEYGRKRN